MRLQNYEYSLSDIRHTDVIFLVPYVKVNSEGQNSLISHPSRIMSHLYYSTAILVTGRKGYESHMNLTLKHEEHQQGFKLSTHYWETKKYKTSFRNSPWEGA